ncbi:MAG: hypothetical protein SGJ16_02635 [Nitrospirota bacterium]|nr:hypothetical protein [Nitrospirota bacterium]
MIRKDSHGVIDYLPCVSDSSREPAESGRSRRNSYRFAEELAPWLTALVPIGLTNRNCDVVAGAGQHSMNPEHERDIRREAEALFQSRTAGRSSMPTDTDHFQDPATPNMIDCLDSLYSLPLR